MRQIRAMPLAPEPIAATHRSRPSRETRTVGFVSSAVRPSPPARSSGSAILARSGSRGSARARPSPCAIALHRAARQTARPPWHDVPPTLRRKYVQATSESPQSAHDHARHRPTASNLRRSRALAAAPARIAGSFATTHAGKPPESHNDETRSPNPAATGAAPAIMRRPSARRSSASVWEWGYDGPRPCL